MSEPPFLFRACLLFGSAVVNIASVHIGLYLGSRGYKKTGFGLWLCTYITFVFAMILWVLTMFRWSWGWWL